MKPETLIKRLSKLIEEDADGAEAVVVGLELVASLIDPIHFIHDAGDIARLNRALVLVAGKLAKKQGGG